MNGTDFGTGFAAGIGFGIIGLVFLVIGIFLFAIIGALMGAITGWILSITPILGDIVRTGFASIGVENPDLVALGAMLGFIAGFFKNWNHKDSCSS